MTQIYSPGLGRSEAEGFRSRVRGCLLGGAVGDALGAPIEYMSLNAIRLQFGCDVVHEYLPAEFAAQTGYGLVTDDTQMTLFTVEGLIRSGMRVGHGFNVSVVHSSLDAWLDTQSRYEPSDCSNKWLRSQKWLYAQRAPEATCLRALAEARGGSARIREYGNQATNDSKGSGAVVRSAPFGLIPAAATVLRKAPGAAIDPVTADRFSLAAEAAGYTHGHPTAKLAAGTLAAVISRLVAGHDLPAAVTTALAILATHEHHEETTSAVRAALSAAAHQRPTAETVEALGCGWVAEEALSIALYAVLACPLPEQFLDALSLAVTHSGDSDSTGAICGGILGALHGDTALPPRLAFDVEGRGTILELADDFALQFTLPHQLHGEHGPHTRWTKRY